MTDFSLTTSHLVVVFLCTSVVSFATSVTGGAGLFTVPFVMWLGVPPQIAVASNKVGSIGLMTGGLSRFRGSGFIIPSLTIGMTLVAGLASFYGAQFLKVFPPELLEKFTGAAILLILVLSVVFKRVGLEDRETSEPAKVIGGLIFTFNCFVAGFFGAGIGVLNLFVLMSLGGLDALKARANSLLPHLAIAVFSLIVLIQDGLVDFRLGASLCAGMFLGGRLGTSYGIKKGARFVKVVFQLIVGTLSIRLLA